MFNLTYSFTSSNCLVTASACSSSLLNKVFDSYKPMISQEELTALNILKKAPHGTVFYPITNGGVELGISTNAFSGIYLKDTSTGLNKRLTVNNGTVLIS